jgi:hypothetical protein
MDPLAAARTATAKTNMKIIIIAGNLRCIDGPPYCEPFVATIPL